MSFLRTAYALAQGMSSGLNLILVAESLASEPMSLPARIVIGAVGTFIDAVITYHFQGEFLSEDEHESTPSSYPEANAGLVIAGKQTMTCVNGMVTYGAIKKFALTFAGQDVAHAIANMYWYEYVIAGIAAFLVDGILSQATGLSTYREKRTRKSAVPTIAMNETGQKVTRGIFTGLHTSSHVLKILTVMSGDWAHKNPSAFAGLMTAACLVYMAGIGTTTWSFESREAIAHITGQEAATTSMHPAVGQVVHTAANISGPVHGFEAAIPAVLMHGPMSQKIILALCTALPVMVGNHFSETKEAQEETREAVGLHTGRKVTPWCCGLLMRVSSEPAGEQLQPHHENAKTAENNTDTLGPTPDRYLQHQ